MVNLISKWFLSERLPNCHLADLDTRWNPKIGIRNLKRWNPKRNDILHYGFLSSVLLFVFVTNPASFLSKLLFYSFMSLLFLIPITSQFFFNALPVLTWASLYFTSSHFPAANRPPITVKVLPTIETMLYGDNLSDILATSTNNFLDILAWLPYGVFHFGAPVVVAIILFIFGPPTILQGFAFAFGYVNLFGVIIQNIFPAAPPWYKILYGLDPANYSMHGSPGGLARIDEIFNISLYTTAFSNSSVIFGAFPSLHSGCATLLALFFSYTFPRLKPLFIFYVVWLWWSTMYLTHHYFVDLMIGSVISLMVFQYVKYYQLPVISNDAFCRWSYSEIKKYDPVKMNPLASSSSSSLGSSLTGLLNDVENGPLELELNDFEYEKNNENNNQTDTFRSESDESSISYTPSIFDEAVPSSRSNATSTTSLGNFPK
ncbi:phosphatase PAP2 family protein NDAI_0E04070 [Naumovozyma dairenensis CBS 421]|uniref:Phosphatidic acid phosphatase type 2/haloperoxidase domain-containing protein n=1 Tax=Naumovozyma dairenensis (strain ATCC 10597 / BCRC 20456 / CBS 421 / NBRC 0211 / NRRL Y-12639) TaxID=1071378 RepID=G0WBV4_NAUDC|nr:hypothetical protein NDAI_0E04070 [Naumovozyma dairenensis CBS 421]CCD25224.1 hypothetical protein NDAI_0E04070 [Naumovozyma dairenensis CBS 421]